MIDRRTFLGTVALAIVAAPRLGEARPIVRRRVPRVGILGEANPVSWMVTTPGVELECRWADAGRESLDGLAAQLVARDVDVLVAVGPDAARGAARRSARIPIVAIIDDADGLPTPSQQNVTRLSAPCETGLAQQRLRLLADVVTRRGVVAVLFNPDTATNVRAVTQLSGATILPIAVRNMDDVERALPVAAREAGGGLLVLADTLFAIHAARLVEVAAEARLPAVYGARSFVDAGGLMALHGSTGDTIRRAAALVQQLLAGVPPAAVVPTPAPRPQLALNLSAAARLGLEIPGAVLAQALVTAA